MMRHSGLKEIFATALGWVYYFTFYLALSVVGVTLIQALMKKVDWRLGFPVFVKWEILFMVFSLIAALFLHVYKYGIQRFIRLGSLFRTFVIYFFAYTLAFSGGAILIHLIPFARVDVPGIESSIAFVIVLITVLRINPQRNFNDPDGPVLHSPVSDFVKDQIKSFGFFNSGVDFPEVWGAPVFAAADGEVVMCWPYKNDGNMIKIAHNKQFSTVYTHLSDINVKYGQQVKKGDVIGYVGNTGHSFEPHLHFEVRYKNRVVDPVHYVEELKSKAQKRSEKKNK